MLIKYHEKLNSGLDIKLEKQVGTKDESVLGAFPEKTTITFSVTLPRALGASGVVMRLWRDGQESVDLPFSFEKTLLSSDTYTLLYKCERVGLYFYELLFLRGFDTLFSDSKNNVDFSLSNSSKTPFHMTVYDESFTTPSRFKGGVMYHVFVDRFKRGVGKASLHTGVINEDWEGGIPQFAKKVGDPLSNDVFFGGNLWGIIEKLDYLKGLGVNILYLSPIFESASNHRYDTANYEVVDSLVGGDEAFDALIKAAHEKGLSVILDGVFNHTGDDSVYFNKRGTYDSVGAYNSKSSPYFEWYNFESFPDDYEAWWGIEIMPRLKHENEACRRYFTGENSISKKWLLRGADGWRLDVADELSDEFLKEFRASSKSVCDALIIGEVWENAVLKEAYSKRREYFQGGQLDSVMNYPVKNAIIELLQNSNVEFFYDTVTELYSSYPKCVSDVLMNIISTHDTERILTVLGDRTLGEGKENADLATLRLSPEKRAEAIELLKIASAIQYTVFGFPSLYYGDEIGMEGYHDPFSRMPFDHKREEKELISHYKMLGRLRSEHPALKDGDFKFLFRDDLSFAYERVKGRDRVVLGVNLGNSEKKTPFVTIPPRSFIILTDF